MYFCPEYYEAIDRILAACHENNKIPGIFLFGTEEVQAYLERGFRWVAVGNDLHSLLSGMTNTCAGIRKSVQGAGLQWEENSSNLIA